MTIDIQNTQINSSAGGISITAGGKTGFSIDAANRAIQSNRPSFYAEGGIINQWYFVNNGSFMIVPFPSVIWNNYSCYSTVTNSFTAPVTGIYWFTSSLYCYKNPSTNSDSYIHPIHFVNGVGTARQACANYQYRLRGRTYSTGAYSFDTQINDVFRLTAGDYVQLQIYGGGSLMYYETQSFFSGVLIG
jgi:hypothetical protein